MKDSRSNCFQNLPKNTTVFGPVHHPTGFLINGPNGPARSPRRGVLVSAFEAPGGVWLFPVDISGCFPEPRHIFQMSRSYCFCIMNESQRATKKALEKSCQFLVVFKWSSYCFIFIFLKDCQPVHPLSHSPRFPHWVPTKYSHSAKRVRSFNKAGDADRFGNP